MSFYLHAFEDKDEDGNDQAPSRQVKTQVRLQDGCEPEPSDLRDKALMLYYAFTNKKFDYDPCLEEILYEIRKGIDDFFGDV